ncbi:hypothetical protein PBY51_019530 [Eleginops maclovinus]|uniref:Uncharacterized protein n=1 Tax=Eleginops maclovinus TaxID=56733 RepID=A0AAN7YDQ9_ELEMC|nr:hypothetical protein PBY51_019530 [Eleginops maclovinus]
MKSSCQGVWTVRVQPEPHLPPQDAPGPPRLLAAPQQSKTLFFQSPTHSSPDCLQDSESQSCPMLEVGR